MKHLAGRLLRRAVLATAGRERIESALAGTAAWLGIDPTLMAYRRIGILNYETAAVSGERHLIERTLVGRIASPEPVLIDVGANRGEMSLALRAAFPAARIVAFEPNPQTFAVLGAATAASSIECVASALGSQPGQLVLHSYRDDPTSGHATLYPRMFELYQNYGVKAAADLARFEIPVTTLDDYCDGHRIARIDFLKLDVEGHELEVLKGARGLLQRAAIDHLQFEFTDCNVWSRTFLRDFYDALEGFEFFRLLPGGLLPLGAYSARNEVFQYQNILAIRKEAP